VVSNFGTLAKHRNSAVAELIYCFACSLLYKVVVVHAALNGNATGGSKRAGDIL